MFEADALDMGVDGEDEKEGGVGRGEGGDAEQEECRRHSPRCVLRLRSAPYPLRLG